MEDTLTPLFVRTRAELSAYLCRLVVRPELAEDLLQATYVRCFEAASRLPDTVDGVRAWLFKVASRLALDELRRHSTWRETMLEDLREKARANESFLEASRAMAGDPETRAIAREHLVACLACTLRNLPERKAAALLLRETHGFSVEQTAGLLDARPAQVKNWIQEARAAMAERYGRTCALLRAEGTCHQCVELDGFLGDGSGSPLREDTGIDARLRIAAELRERPWGPWHRLMLRMIDELA